MKDEFRLSGISRAYTSSPYIDQGDCSTYISTLAPALKTHDQAVASAQHAYEQAAAGAKRDHTISGDQAAYSAALAAAGQARSASNGSAAAALRSAARGAQAGRIRGAAQAEKNFVVNEAGAWQTFVIAAAGHLETLLATEAQAEYDLVEAVVTETAAYWMLATRAYADRMVLLAGTGSPWAQYHAAAWVAHADWVDQVAPAERDRRIAAAEAARDREIAEAAAEKNKTIAKAQAQHQRAVNDADAAYERADAEADAVLHDVHFVVVWLQLPPAGGGPPLASSLLGAAEPLLVTELLGLHDFFGELSQGFAGDGTYLGIIDSLLARRPERDELGYTSSFQRVLGETIRGWVGDQILVNATDTQLFIGTLGFSAAVVVMGWANVKMAAIGLGVGLLVGGGMNVLGQIDANWNSSGSLLWAVSQVDVGEAAGAGFLAGMQGAALGGAFGGLGALASRWGLCKYLTPALKWGGRGLAAKGIYDGVNQIADGNWLTGTGTVVLGAFSYRAAGRASICFVAGTQVVKYAVPEPLIVSIDPAPPEQAANWSFSYLALAGATLAAGLWGVRGAKQWRQEDEETEARRLWFAHQGQQKGDQPYPEQDDDAPWPEPLAGDAGDDTRWQQDIDRLCEALFHGEEHDDLLVPSRSAAGSASTTLPVPASSAGTQVGWTFLSDARRKRTSIPPTRAQKSQAQTPEPIANLDRPPRSKQQHSRPDAGLCRKRQIWLAACLVLSGSFFWKSLPQDVNRPTAQLAADSIPTVLASTEPQPRYVTESIERLRIGDMVLAMDPATGEIDHHRVVGHFQRTAYELRVLEFIGSDAKRQRIETTDEHPFFVLSEGDFLPAAELQIGDQCPGPQGEIQTLVATRLEPRPEGVPVFNFEVQHAHTYYVQAEDLQGAPLLVHNRCNERTGGGKHRNTGPRRFLRNNPQYKGTHEIHHSREWNLLDRFPGTYTPQELNAQGFMRPIRYGHTLHGKPLHRNVIRDSWDRFDRVFGERYRDGLISKNKMRMLIEKHAEFIDRFYLGL